MNINLCLIFLFLSSVQISFIYCLRVELSSDGPGVLDLPITFNAKLIGESPLVDTEYWYVFEDRGIFPRHREELVSGREANFTTTYHNVSTQEYIMKVQVFVVIWGLKGWLLTEDAIEFKLQNALVVDMSIEQINTTKQAIDDWFVATNRSVLLSASVSGHFMKDAETTYQWDLDGKTYDPKSDPVLNYTFASNKSYDVKVTVKSLIRLQDSNVTKIGHNIQTIRAFNEIKDVNVIGNNFIKDGKLLHLQVNCSGGDPPFEYCYHFFNKKQDNFTCDSIDYKSDDCSFEITRYFPRNGTYFVEIGISNRINFKHKTITVKVYDNPKKTSLFFVIIPIMSSILAIVIIVFGIAYHLRQRQRLNETLEVADFDFQNNDHLIVRTFFERLRESIASGFRETFSCHQCNPCTRPNNYDEPIDDTLTDNYNTNINTNDVSYGIVK